MAELAPKAAHKYMYKNVLYATQHYALYSNQVAFFSLIISAEVVFKHDRLYITRFSCQFGQNVKNASTGCLHNSLNTAAYTAVYL